MQLSFEGEGGYLEGEKVPQIYAVDDQDESWYVLVRKGYPPVSAAWPSMLKHICPEAIMGGTLGTGSTHERMGEVNGHLEDYVSRVYAYGPGGGNKQVWTQGQTPL